MFLCLPPAQQDTPNFTARPSNPPPPPPASSFPYTLSPPRWLRRALGSLDKWANQIARKQDCAQSCFWVNLSGGLGEGQGGVGMSGEGRGPASSLSAVPPRWERPSLNSQPIFCPSRHFIPSLELSSGPDAVTG